MRFLSCLKPAGRWVVGFAVHHVVVANLMLLLFVGGMAVLLARELPWDEHFVSLASYIFSSVTVAVAGVAALCATVASILAYEAHRPLVDVLQPACYDPRKHDDNRFSLARINFKVENSGSLPADNVSIECCILREEEDNGTQLLAAAAIPSIHFPGRATNCTFEASSDDAHRLTMSVDDALRVRIRIAYENKLRGHRQFHTVRSYRIEFSPSDAKRECGPLPDGDSWD